MKEQIEALRQELSSLGKDEQERILICKTAFIRGWKGFLSFDEEEKQLIRQGAPGKLINQATTIFIISRAEIMIMQR